MNILILEDDEVKRKEICCQIELACPRARLSCVYNFSSFLKRIEREDFDLIIVDLVVPQFKDMTSPSDMTVQIIDATRDHYCRNFRTPVVAITSYDVAAEENFRGLNGKDINVITFGAESGDWKDALRRKVLASIPPIQYDLVVVCALEKEAEGFNYADCTVGSSTNLFGLDCKELNIGGKLGVIVTAPRMGLVSAAVTATRAIETFRPKLLCMSGICAGVEGKSEIYDVIVSEACHQHDFGKWGALGFESEVYSVQLLHDVSLRIKQVLGGDGFKEEILKGLVPNRSEIPDGKDVFDFGFCIAPTSSGSAVIAQRNMAEMIRVQQRKMAAFEMESFAIVNGHLF